MLHAEAKLARHQATAANNCKKSAALEGPARAAPMAQQKLATNWNAKESCSLFWLGICCRLSQFGKQATVEPWLIVWYSGFSGVVGVGKGQEGGDTKVVNLWTIRRTWPRQIDKWNLHKMKFRSQQSIERCSPVLCFICLEKLHKRQPATSSHLCVLPPLREANRSVPGSWFSL